MSNQIKSIKDIVQVLQKIEIEENIFLKKFQEVYFWKLMRFNLMSEIGQKIELMERAHDIKVNKKDKLFYLLKNIIINTVKNSRKEVPIIIFDEDAYFYKDNEKKSKFFFKIYEDLKKDKIDFEVVGPLYSKENWEYRQENIYYFYFKIIEILKIKLKIFTLKKEEKDYLKNIKNNLEKNTNIDNLNTLEEKAILKEISGFKSRYKYYNHLFKQKKVKQIYIICSYGKEPIIAAAQDLGIEVIELQHGVFNEYHLGYSFSGNSIPYFPDKFYLFGDYWKKNKFLPQNTEKKVYGYPYLRNQLERYKNIEKNKNQVVFISQGPIGKKLSQRAVEFAKENPDLKIVYRLHPGEFLRWKTEYKELNENRNLKNLEISDNNDKNLYEYLFESEYLIGVYSTVIYEALEIGLKIGIIKLFAYEYVEELIAENIIYAFDENEKIDLKLLNNLKKNKKGYFFKED